MQQVSLPSIYLVTSHPLTLSDNTTYGGLNGHYTIKDTPGPNLELGEEYLLPLNSVEESTGHLKEVLSMGATLIRLNIRPGWHHIYFKS